MPKQMSQTVIVLACNLGCVVLVTPEQAIGAQLLAASSTNACNFLLLLCWGLCMKGATRKHCWGCCKIILTILCQSSKPEKGHTDSFQTSDFRIASQRKFRKIHISHPGAGPFPFIPRTHRPQSREFKLFWNRFVLRGPKLDQKEPNSLSA